MCEKMCNYCQEYKSYDSFRKDSYGKLYDFCKACNREFLKKNKNLVLEGLKLCRECLYVLPLDYFGPMKRGIGCKKSKCKQCLSNEQQVYYRNNLEDRLKYANNYLEEHKDEINTKNREKYNEDEEYKEKCKIRNGIGYILHREERLESNKEYRKNNKEVIAERDKKYRETHKEEIALYGAIWYQNNREHCYEVNKKWKQENPEKVDASRKKWLIAHPTYKTDYSRERYRNDPVFRIQSTLRARLNQALKGMQKLGSAVRDIACEIEQLILWLEAQFYNNPETGEIMSWENYGKGGWEIDHVIPLRFFDLENREEFLKANHFSNLQPLWQKDHVEKGRYEHIFAQHI